MRIVIVNPRIWKVNVIGIGTPFTEDSRENRPSLFWRPWGSKRTLTILPDQSKNVNLRRLCPLDKSKVSGIIKVTKDASTSGCPRLVYEVKKMFLKPSLCRVAVSPVNADRNSQSKDMESQSDRHRNTPFTEDSGENRPSLFWRPWGSKRTLTILPDQSKNVNLRRLCPLDKSKVSGIIKVTKDASTSGCPRLVYEVKKMFLKPSLCRVAVSPVNADRNSQSKDMESQCDRHRNTPFTEDSGENRPSLFWRPWGSKRTIPILPDRSKNVNQWRMLCHWQKKSMAFYTTGGRCR